MLERPGGAIAKRPLQFIWIVDCSGSMQGKKIETLNFAIREAIPPMRDTADENPNAEVMMRVIKFSDAAQWQVAEPTNVRNFVWRDLDADGLTAMGAALSLVADAMSVEQMPQRGLPPVLVLISDGQPSDDFDAGLKALMTHPWGSKAVRIAVAIGEDANLDVLQQFIGNPEIKPLVASNAQDLVKKIRWASTVPLKAASNPGTRAHGAVGGSAAGNVQIPAPPADTPAVAASDVF